MGCQLSTFRFPSRRSRRLRRYDPRRLPPPPLSLSHEGDGAPAPHTRSQSVEQQLVAHLPPPPQSHREPETQSGQQQLLLRLPPPKSCELENKDSKKEDNNPVPIVDWNTPAVYDVYLDQDDKLLGNEVTERLKAAGMESAKLIVGFDFTETNEQRGARSFKGKSLHYIGAEQNPYEEAVSIIWKTLYYFDRDRMIPCFGFGDASTDDQEVFSFYPDESACCNGYEEVIKRYREVVPQLQLGGPKSFAPVIEMAMTIVEQSGGQYHVLVILADGQVTRGDDTSHLSAQEKATVEAIVKASEYPLSIVVIGVGDGPWDKMKKFERKIPRRAFDNFRFVNAADILTKDMASDKKEVKFASAAFLQLPSQYKATQELSILGATRENAVCRTPLPPPRYSSGFVGSDRAPRAPDNSQVCPICLAEPKDMAFGCGHQTCRDCGQAVLLCPICRSTINLRIKLY